MRIGVMGYGYWGPNLVRNFVEVPDCQVVAVSDLSEDRLRLVRTRYPAIETSTDYRSVLSRTDIDAVAIATPVSTHFDLASRALEAGKHVFITKPLTQTTSESERLIELAEQRRLVLHVDHTFVYTPAVQKIRDIVRSGELGDVYYYDSVRVNLGLFQPDVNVIWDLAAHDLSILHHILPSTPAAVSATGMSHVPRKPANIAYLTLFFENDVIAHLHVNWLAPVKLRRTLIGGSRKMIVYDDLEPSEKVKVYDKGITVTNGNESVYKTLIGYRTGDMWAPQLEMAEALQVEARHFLACVTTGARSVTDGHAGLAVVRILAAATESMNRRGRPVELARHAVDLARRPLERQSGGQDWKGAVPT